MVQQRPIHGNKTAVPVAEVGTPSVDFLHSRFNAVGDGINCWARGSGGLWGERRSGRIPRLICIGTSVRHKWIRFTGPGERVLSGIVS
jgi:hypothetical protein